MSTVPSHLNGQKRREIYYLGGDGEAIITELTAWPTRQDRWAMILAPRPVLRVLVHRVMGALK